MVNKDMQELLPLQVAVMGVLGEGADGIEEIKDLAALAKATGQSVGQVEKACNGLVASGHVRCAGGFDGDAMMWYWITDFGKRQLDSIIGRGPGLSSFS